MLYLLFVFFSYFYLNLSDNKFDITIDGQVSRESMCKELSENGVKFKDIECKVLYNGLSALVGAAAGDSIGGRLEFWKPGHRNSDVNFHQAIGRALDWSNGINSWDVTGGGEHSLKAGETTDDTAMGTCLARGLIEGNPTDLENIQQKIFNNYNLWATVPRPFDIGYTTRMTIGLSTVKDALEAATKNNLRAVDRYGNGVLSNGALMRIMPLALYSYKLTNDEIYKLVKLDSDLTNSNQIVTDAVTAYVIALRYLIVNKKDENGKLLIDNALLEAKTYLEKLAKKEDGETQLHKEKDIPIIDGKITEGQIIEGEIIKIINGPIIKGKPAELVLKWLLPIDRMDDITKQQEEKHAIKTDGKGKILDGQFVGANDNKLFRVDVAIQRAFYWLKFLSAEQSFYDYKFVIHNVLKECGTDEKVKGDSDTNAAIVGALIGAYFGLNNIPTEYRETLTAAQTSHTKQAEHYQSHWYWKSNHDWQQDALALALVQRAPDNLLPKPRVFVPDDLPAASWPMVTLGETIATINWKQLNPSTVDILFKNCDENGERGRYCVSKSRIEEANLFIKDFTDSFALDKYLDVSDKNGSSDEHKKRVKSFLICVGAIYYKYTYKGDQEKNVLWGPTGYSIDSEIISFEAVKKVLCDKVWPEEMQNLLKGSPSKCH